MAHNYRKMNGNLYSEIFFEKLVMFPLFRSCGDFSKPSLPPMLYRLDIPNCNENLSSTRCHGIVASF